MDDNIILSKDVEEHMHHIGDILATIGEVGVKLELKNFQFLSDYFYFLGHMMRPGRKEIDQYHTKRLMDDKPPTKRSALRSFECVPNFYRRSI